MFILFSIALTLLIDRTSSDVPEVTQQIRNYWRFRGVTTKWVELVIELAKLKR